MGKTPPKKAKALRESQLQIRITDSEKEIFTKAAEDQHLSVSAWIRLAALHAAKSQHSLG